MDLKLEKVFGDVLRDARSKAGLSQEELAHSAGLDRTYISLLERGQRQPTLKTVFAIAKVLRVAPSTLVSRLEDKLRED